MRENPSPNSINQMKTYNFELLADYFQLYLQDETAKGDLGEAWTEEACALKLAVVPGIIGVGTARDMTVPLTVEIHESDPGEIPGTWDQINNCSIDITSGKLVVSGCTDYFPTAARIELCQVNTTLASFMAVKTQSAPMACPAMITIQLLCGRVKARLKIDCPFNHQTAVSRLTE